MRSNQGQFYQPRYTHCYLPGWDDLPDESKESHNPNFLKILQDHGFNEISLKVPLKPRYTKGRRWTEEEFEACYAAWKAEKSLTFIAAALNRNPQDMIYKLLKRCREDGLDFSQANRSEGSANWTSKVASCSTELFEAGLPAWRIAVTFRVDFEHVEKQLFLGRADYGHKKKNPFAICTEHKRLVNEKILQKSPIRVTSAFDAFAGKGNFTKSVHRLFPEASIVAVEVNYDTCQEAIKQCQSPNVGFVNEDNLVVMERLKVQKKQFDLVDLDPFVSCCNQIPLVWSVLTNEALLFVTFGGEYRRSFISSNRKAIARRYGFRNDSLSNQEYLEIVPYYFLGWVAAQAAEHDFTIEPIRAVRYPNNCRFWLKVVRKRKDNATQLLNKKVVFENGGHRWLELRLPRFREVRYELDQRHQLELFQ